MIFFSPGKLGSQESTPIPGTRVQSLFLSLLGYSTPPSRYYDRCPFVLFINLSDAPKTFSFSWASF